MYRIFTRSIHKKAKPPAKHVLLSKDESCILVHHPEVEHNYNNTIPLPKVSEEQTILKENSRDMITKAPNLEQLQILTYTPARFWKQFPGLEKRKKYKNYFNDTVDRKGLTS